MSELERPEAVPPGPAPIVPRARRSWGLGVAVILATALPLVLVLGMGGPNPAAGDEKKAKADAQKDPEAQPDPPVEKKKVAAPELDGGVAWLNSPRPAVAQERPQGQGRPARLLDALLHQLHPHHARPCQAREEVRQRARRDRRPLARSSTTRRTPASIRKAILRYQIEHPVVNDADHKIWDHYEVDAWPTLVLIDPEGNLVGYTSGEGNYDLLDTVVGKLVDEHKKKKTLNEKPIRFDLAQYRENGDTPLFFPGKVLADEKGKRLFIADSTHHRVVVTDLDGKLIAVAGTGVPGKADGAFDKAEFHDPQGMAVKRRHALCRRPQEPRHPRTRPEGEDGEDHRRERPAGARPDQPPARQGRSRRATSA